MTNNKISTIKNFKSYSHTHSPSYTTAVSDIKNEPLNLSPQKWSITRLPKNSIYQIDLKSPSNRLQVWRKTICKILNYAFKIWFTKTKKKLENFFIIWNLLYKFWKAPAKINGNIPKKKIRLKLSTRNSDKSLPNLFPPVIIAAWSH